MTELNTPNFNNSNFMAESEQLENTQEIERLSVELFLSAHPEIKNKDAADKNYFIINAMSHGRWQKAATHVLRQIKVAELNARIDEGSMVFQDKTLRLKQLMNELNQMEKERE